MPRNQVILYSIKNLELIEEHKRLRENGDSVSLSVSAYWDSAKGRKFQTQSENRRFKAKRGNDLQYPEFEKLVLGWARKIFDEDLRVSDELIREKLRSYLNSDIL